MADNLSDRVDTGQRLRHRDLQMAVLIAALQSRQDL